jgi:predicted secreted hydrolase
VKSELAILEVQQEYLNQHVINLEREAAITLAWVPAFVLEVYRSSLLSPLAASSSIGRCLVHRSGWKAIQLYIAAAFESQASTYHLSEERLDRKGQERMT